MRRRAILLLACALVVSGCDQSMIDQPKSEEYETSALFPDGKVNQAPVDGTVAHGDLAYRRAATTRPPLTRDLIARGRERFVIYCSPCHGATGAGDGMVVRRGFPAPPSFHIPRLREQPPRYFVGIIEHGGRTDMYPYASRVAPTDRWAVAAYIKALQLSQRIAADRLPADLRKGLEGMVGEDAP